MPVITISMGEGQANIQQKNTLVNQITKVAAEVTELPENAFTILISELPHSNIGVGGKTLSDLLKS